MSDEPRVGEWATVVGEHCEGARVVGLVVQVEAIEPPYLMIVLRCPCGGTYAAGEPHALLVGKKLYHPLRWLKRFPPEDAKLQAEVYELYGRPEKVGA